MKKKYTKKQILESIKYWKKQLKTINENISNGQPYSYKTIAEGLQDLYFYYTSSVDAELMDDFDKDFSDIYDMIYPNSKKTNHKYNSVIEALDNFSFQAQCYDEHGSLEQIIKSIDGIKEVIGEYK